MQPPNPMQYVGNIFVGRRGHGGNLVPPKKYKNKVETAGTDTSDTNFKIRINLDVSCPNFDFKEEEIPIDNILN